MKLVRLIYRLVVFNITRLIVRWHIFPRAIGLCGRNSLTILSNFLFLFITFFCYGLPNIISVRLFSVAFGEWREKRTNDCETGRKENIALGSFWSEIGAGETFHLLYKSGCRWLMRKRCKFDWTLKRGKGNGKGRKRC